MKRVNPFTRIGFAILLCVSASAVFIPATAAAGKDRCKDRCNRRYHELKDSCRGLRRFEKRRCEERAKFERDECRRRCR
jgi:hypothetical protein